MLAISSLRASDQLAKALESRAFGTRGIRRTTLHDIEFRTLDYVLTVMILAALIVLLFMNLRLGFGTHPVKLL